MERKMSSHMQQQQQQQQSRSQKDVNNMSLEERVHQVITGMARSQSSGSLLGQQHEDGPTNHNNALARRLRRREHQDLSIHIHTSSKTNNSTNYPLDPIRAAVLASGGRSSPSPNGGISGRTSPMPIVIPPGSNPQQQQQQQQQFTSTTGISNTNTSNNTANVNYYYNRKGLHGSDPEDVHSTVSSPSDPHVAVTTNKLSASLSSNHNIPRAPTTNTTKSMIATPTTTTTTSRAPRSIAKEKFKLHRRSSSTEHAPLSHLSISTTSVTTNTATNTRTVNEETTNAATTNNIKMNKLPPTGPLSNHKSGDGGTTSTITQPPKPSSTTTTTSTKVLTSTTTAATNPSKPLLRRSRSASPIKSSPSSFLIKTQHSPKLMMTRKNSKSNTIDYKQRTFQKPQDQMKLYVATMDHSLRCMFRPTSTNPKQQQQFPPLLAQLARKASTSVHASTALSQISPSLQLYTIQHYLSTHTHRRQLIWSPTVSPEADPFHGWDSSADEDGYSSSLMPDPDEFEPPQQQQQQQQQLQEEKLVPSHFSFNQQQLLKKKRVGRYYPMQTCEYVKSKLPPHPPLLSVRKHRLPMRSDVGFPNCKEEEVLRKQKEIQLEASWEEACPRLAVLFSARDVGEFCQLRKILDTQGASAMAAEQQQKERKQAEYSSVSFTNHSAVAHVSYFEEVVMASTTTSANRKRPNPASVFAPPLESVPAGRGWKPRPVSDRPPGLRYVLVDPIKVTFDDVGDLEPLICTLALYSAKGWVKISEDFSFPAGEWRDNLNVTDVINASAFDVEVNSPSSESASTILNPNTSKSAEQGSSWKLWRQKALMTFLSGMNDGSATSFTGETASHEDIYVVLTVSKVAYEGALLPYLPDHSGKKHSTPLKHLSRRFGSVKKSNPSDELETCRSRAWAVFSNFGTQFLTPICFGAVPIFDTVDLEQDDGVSANYRWPGAGCTQTIELFAFPSQPADSRDVLAERLSFLYSQELLPRPNSHKVPNLTTSISDKPSIQPVTSMNIPKSKGFMHRVGSKSTASEKSLDEISSVSSNLEVPTRLHGQAIVTSTFLGADFTKVLQTSDTSPSAETISPMQLSASSNNDSIKSEEIVLRPMKLLVDVMGDFAVASRTRIQSKNSGSSFSKRTDRLNIVRLPRSQQTAGYTDAADVREVLFLPPADYLPNCFTSNFLANELNLLFVYPKVLKLEDATDNKENIRLHAGMNKIYTIQICLVKHGGNSSSIKVLDAIYNPAPGGKALLKSLYTKISPNRTQTVKFKLSESVFYMHDEVKMRLPTVLDDSYCLSFSLFSVSLRANEGAHAQDLGFGSMEMVGNAQLPLLNIQNKEPASKVNVSTIVSDKLHELKLGSFLLTLETKVMSSLHISDPSVVTILRDFPIALKGDFVQPQAYQIGNCPFSSIIDASTSADLTRNFDILMYVHFRNLTQTKRTDFDFSRIVGCFPEHGAIGILRMDSTVFCDSRSLLDALHSLLSVLDKIKSSFFLQSESSYSSLMHQQQHRMSLFFKRFFDLFEEEVLRQEDAFPNHLFYLDQGDFSSSDQMGNEISLITADKVHKNGSQENTSGESVDEFNFDYILDLNSDSMEDNSVHPSIRKIGLRSRSKIDNDLRSLGQYTNSSRDMPFSRRAYGASKLHRMRIEAELGEDSSFRHRSPENYIYDDATIITTTTWHEPLSDRSESYIKMQREERNSIGKEKVVKSIEPLLQESTNQSPSSNLHGQIPEKKSRSPYNIFFSPCVAPSYDSVALPDESRVENDNLSVTRERHVFLQPKKNISTFLSEVETGNNTKPNSVNSVTVCSPGSDIDDETDDGSSAGDLTNQVPRKALTGIRLWNHPEASAKSRLRGNLNLFHGSNQLILSIGDQVQNSEENYRPFLYESILALWLRVWLENMQSGMESSVAVRLSRSFINCIEFFAPLCLKSMALRFSDLRTKKVGSNSKLSMGKTKLSPTLLDYNHMKLLTSIIVVWVHSLMSRTVAGMKADEDDDSPILSSIYSCDSIIDFIIGMMPMVHVAQVSVLIQTYLQSLRALEAVDYKKSMPSLVDKNNSRESIAKRMIASRHLRLRLIDRIACLPCFVALNYPLRYPSSVAPARFKFPTWTHQLPDNFSVVMDSSSPCPYPDGCIRLPQAHWLAEMLADDALLISADSCEAILSDTLDRNEDLELSKKDVNRLQSLAVDGIAILYESLIRRHAVDARFQGEEARSRIAAMLVSSVLRSALENYHWLSRMDGAQKVRIMWLLCFLHVLQEAPEFLIREQLRIFCNPQNFLLVKFVRVLKLCHGSFQGLITPQMTESSSNPDVSLSNLTPWIVQECFNIICAAANVIVDECADIIRSIPLEKKKLVSGLANLLLSIMSSPQSSVTQLRALGGASQTIDKFGSSLFVECVGDHLQHWMRVVLSLMNSTSLSVRSIAVDFMISLLGSTFEENGTIDEILLVVFTVLPEVAAREVAMYSASGQVSTVEDVETVLWPLRRAIADVEEANPMDDSRVDVHLVPFLINMCSSCQAILDGILIELRLQDEGFIILGSKMTLNGSLDSSPVKLKGKKNSVANGKQNDFASWTRAFDADEESVYEAANAFLPETAPMQKLRWLLTLKKLHESKGQWLEAAETLRLCARTIADSIPHLKSVWRPSKFKYWRDERVSLWIPSVGADFGSNKNDDVMAFADNFLEPRDAFYGILSSASSSSSRLQQPTIETMCSLLTVIAREAAQKYSDEGGVETLAFLRLEELVKSVMGIVESMCSVGIKGGKVYNGIDDLDRRSAIEESAALRKMSAVLNGELSKVAERMLFKTEDSHPGIPSAVEKNSNCRQYYIRLVLLGNKPKRFLESTGLPTFLEWGRPAICRVPRTIIRQAVDGKRGKDFNDLVCTIFAQPLLQFLAQEISDDNIIVRYHPPIDSEVESNHTKTFLVVTLLNSSSMANQTSETDCIDPLVSGGSKRFVFRSKASISAQLESSNSAASGKLLQSPCFVESVVGQRFPCALSRQRVIFTSEFVSGTMENEGETLYRC